MSKRLDEDTWNDVVVSLKETIPHYERVNRVITFGLSNKMRKLLLSTPIPEGSSILDVGCGPGQLSRLILERCPTCKIICMDPLPEMLKAAALNLNVNGNVQFIRGVFEKIPLEDSCVDVVVASYSFRDSFDKEKALLEVRRVLKPGGRFMVLELARPNNKAFATLVGWYIRFLVPVMSALVIRKWKTPWRALYKTYVNMLTAEQLRNLINEFLEVEEQLNRLGGTFTIIRARKP